jgi:hypothetical protein
VFSDNVWALEAYAKVRRCVVVWLVVVWMARGGGGEGLLMLPPGAMRRARACVCRNTAVTCHELRRDHQALGKPFIYGKTSHSERVAFLAKFKRTNEINTIFLSKVCDVSSRDGVTV